nr:MAG TPA_asm: hypothetical protein [Caudoviricetes sp.]
MIRSALAISSLTALANALMSIHSASDARNERIFRSVPSFAAGLLPAPSLLPPQPALLSGFIAFNLPFS